MQVIGADPAGSVYSGGTGRPYLVEGVGEDFWPETYDRYGRRPRHRGLRRRLVRVHPPAGARGGHARGRLVRHGRVRRASGRPGARRHPEGDDAVIVVLLPDSGRGYLTKVFNDEWLAQYGFANGITSSDQTVGEVLRGKSVVCPTWCTPTRPRPSPRRWRSCRSTASPRCRWCAPSRRSWPPRSPGSVSERTLLEALFTGAAHLADSVEQHMSPPLPTIGSSESAHEAVALLEDADAVLVHEDGKPVGVLTRQDLLGLPRRRLTPAVRSAGGGGKRGTDRGHARVCGRFVPRFPSRARSRGAPDPLCNTLAMTNVLG